MAAAAIGCAAHVPPPALLLESGVKTDRTGFRKEEVTSFSAPAGKRVTRVMQLGWDESTGQLRVVTEFGIRWIDLANGTQRDVTFPRQMFRAKVIQRSDGGLRVVGLSGHDDIPVMTLDGTIEHVIDAEYMATSVVADVAGDRSPELLLTNGGDMRVHDATGKLLGFVRAPRYTSARAVVQADDDPALEVAFVKTSLAYSWIEVRVVNADSSLVSEWRSEEGKWLSSAPALGTDTLWGLTTRGFTAWDAFGRERESYPAEGVDYLRDVLGARAGGYVALVASGNGYRNRSVIAIYGEAKQMVYQEVFDGRAYTLIADRSGASFLLGVGNQVIRYSALQE